MKAAPPPYLKCAISTIPLNQSGVLIAETEEPSRIYEILHAINKITLKRED